MGLLSSKKEDKNTTRKFYIDLLSSEEIIQPEDYCGNEIKTTHYTM
jgi:hypothetical protein